MNAYFDNVRHSNSIRTHEIDDRRFGDGLISFICAVIALFTCSAAIKLEKTVVVVALFLSFFGIVGAIEAGTLSMLLGILICGGISLLEYTVLKSMFKPAKKN